MSPRLSVSAGDSPPVDVTQRAMALESVAERTHVHEEKTPAEARRRREGTCVIASDVSALTAAPRDIPSESRLTPPRNHLRPSVKSAVTSPVDLVIESLTADERRLAQMFPDHRLPSEPNGPAIKFFWGWGDSRRGAETRRLLAHGAASPRLRVTPPPNQASATQHHLRPSVKSAVELHPVTGTPIS